MGILSFSHYQWIAIVAVGVITPLVDSHVEVILPTFFYNNRGVVNIFSFSGGPLNGDLLVAWEEYGAVVAAYLVRKPGAATIAMSINGLGQFVLDGFTGPHHLLYGVAGLGADLTFAAFRYRRFDVVASTLAGLMSQLFWIPITYTYHSVIGHYSISFIEGDLFARMIGGVVGDGLMGFAIGFAVMTIAKRVSKARKVKADTGWSQVSVHLKD